MMSVLIRDGLKPIVIRNSEASRVKSPGLGCSLCAANQPSATAAMKQAG